MVVKENKGPCVSAAEELTFLRYKVVAQQQRYDRFNPFCVEDLIN